MSSGIYILYISIFYIVFIRKRFKAGEKNSGRFCQGDRENGNMRKIRKTKRAPKGSCLLICCASELDILHRYGMPAGDSSTATSWHTVISA